MNINCLICSDLFLPTSKIYSTKCGHIFHSSCLKKWLNSSDTCPVCRSESAKKTSFRIFFNILNSEGIAEDAPTLQNKVENLNFQLKIKEDFVKTTEEEIKRVTTEKKSLDSIINDLKSKLNTCKSGNASLKEQVRFYKEQVHLIEMVQSENKELKDKLRTLELESTILTGTLEDAHNIANSENEETLSLFVMSLKKELIAMKKKRDHVVRSLSSKENELRSYRKYCRKYEAQNKVLNLQLQSHKQCEVEMATLKKQIKDLMENKVAVNPRLVRVVTESPAPMLTKMKQKNVHDLSFEEIKSPSVSARVKDIKDSESPYLTVKSNSLSMFLKSDTDFNSSTSTSIFKKSSSACAINTNKKLDSEENYDVFGGHAEEDRYPTPKLFGLKRAKFSGLLSNKFRKNDKTNIKLDNFFDIKISDFD